MMKVSMRVLDPADLGALSGIAPEVVAAAAMLVQTGSGWSSRILVDDMPAGIVALTPDGELSLYLDPTFQRHGVGTTVLSSTVRRAREANLPRVHAKVRAGSGGEALARKVGLQQIRAENGEVFFELVF